MGLLVVAAAGAPSARAWSGPPSTVVNSAAYWDEVWALSTGDVVLDGGVSTGVRTVTARAVFASGTIPYVGAGVSALGAGYLIGTGLDNWLHISCRIASNCEPESTINNATFNQWERHSDYPYVSSNNAVTGYWARVSWDLNNACATPGTFVYWWTEASNPSCYGSTGQYLQARGLEKGVGSVTIVGNNGIYQGVMMTEAEAVALVTVDAGPEPHVSQSYVGSYAPPSDPGTGSATAAAIRAALLSEDEATDVAIAMLIDPTYEGLAPETAEVPDCTGLTPAACAAALSSAGFTATPTEVELGLATADLEQPAGAVVSTDPAQGATVELDSPFELSVNPDPLPLLLLAPVEGPDGETYAQYMARLAAAGYVGTASELVLTDATLSPEYGPDAVVTTSPAPGTRIWPSDAITVRVNPQTAPLPAGAGACEGYLTAEPDLTPLDGHAFADKFPFAIFTWIASGFGAWEVTGEAPSITIPFIHGDLVLDFADFEPAMMVVRPVILAGALILMVWGLATGLLGLRGQED